MRMQAISQMTGTRTMAFCCRATGYPGLSEGVSVRARPSDWPEGGRSCWVGGGVVRMEVRRSAGRGGGVGNTNVVPVAMRMGVAGADPVSHRGVPQAGGRER